MLWNRSLVMYDKETNSHWSHIRGEAMQGKMMGTKLSMFPSELTTWADWRAKHPDTTLLNLSRTAKRFTKEFYKNPSEFVFGWTIRRQRYHYQLSALVDQPIVNLDLEPQALVIAYDAASTRVLLLSRVAGDKVLHFEATGPGKMRDRETGSLWSLETGRAVEGPLQGTRLKHLLGMLSYKRAWSTFFPHSRDMTQ